MQSLCLCGSKQIVYGESNSSGMPQLFVCCSLLSLSFLAIRAKRSLSLPSWTLFGVGVFAAANCAVQGLLTYLLTYVQASGISVENNVYFDHIIHIESQCNKAVIKTYKTAA